MLAAARTSLIELEARLEELEEKFQSNLNLEIINKVDFLQKEIQELRGSLEEQQHLLHKLCSDPALISAYVSNTKLHPEPKEPNLDLEQITYNQAYKMVEEKHFPQAIIAFKDFLVNYANSRYAPSSIYLLGELYLQENNLTSAEGCFLQLLEQHKEHNKAPDALLKLGTLEIERKNFSKAKDYLFKLITNYADSNRVQIAKAKLSELEKIVQ